jgi:hypothetical protein
MNLNLAIKTRGDSDTIYSKVYSLAYFKGDDSAFNKFIKMHVVYPENSGNVEVQIFISFIVETNGELSNVKAHLQNNSEKYFYKESLRLVNLSSGMWKPAYRNGKPLRSRSQIVIDFDIWD